MPRLRNAAACQRAVSRAMGWLKKQCGDEPAWTLPSQPLASYHKVPYLLAAWGSPEECRQALNWVKTNLFTREGDFLAAPAEEDQPPGPTATIREKVWLVLAAQVSGRFDISFPAVRFLASQQGGVTGGVYDRDAKGTRLDCTDVRTVAAAGGAFLLCGILPAARLCGRFLVRALQAQPEAGRFYLRWDSRGNVVSRFPGGRAESHVVVRTDRRSSLSDLAAAAIFLAELHRATADPEFLEIAMDYFAFAQECRPEKSADDDSATHGWAAAALYGVARRRMYYDAAESMAQTWIDRQKPDGTWRLRGATRDDAATMALTAQTALGLLESLREAQ